MSFGVNLIQSHYRTLGQITSFRGRFRVGCGGVLRNEAEFRERCGGLVRNEATGGVATLLLKTAQLVERFVEGALVGGLVAEEEGEPLFVNAGRGEAVTLEADGALFEPVGLGELVDEEVFGRAGGLMIFDEGLQKSFEFCRVFTGNDERAGCEAVFERITRRSQFALGGDGAGGVEGVGAVGFGSGGQASFDSIAGGTGFGDELGGKVGVCLSLRLAENRGLIRRGVGVVGSGDGGWGDGKALLFALQFLLFALGRAADGSWRHGIRCFRLAR